MGPALLKLLQRAKGLGMGKDEIMALMAKAGGKGGEMAGKAGASMKGAAEKARGAMPGGSDIEALLRQGAGKAGQGMGAVGRMVRQNPTLAAGIGGGLAGMGGGAAISELAGDDMGDLDEEQLLKMLMGG